MFAIVLIAIVIVIAVVARLVTAVRNDRSLNAPRSHTHELDSHSAGMFRFV